MWTPSSVALRPIISIAVATRIGYRAQRSEVSRQSGKTKGTDLKGRFLQLPNELYSGLFKLKHFVHSAYSVNVYLFVQPANEVVGR